MKTSDYNKEVKIYLFADLLGTGVDLKDIERLILNTPYECWNIDSYNTIRTQNDQLVDLFVFETYKSICFNINEVF